MWRSESQELKYLQYRCLKKIGKKKKERKGDIYYFGKLLISERAAIFQTT